MELLTAESREKAGQLEARADAADREISELREEMRNMRLQMDTAEKTQQADIEPIAGAAAAGHQKTDGKGSLTAGPCACGARAAAAQFFRL